MMTQPFHGFRMDQCTHDRNCWFLIRSPYALLWRDIALSPVISFLNITRPSSKQMDTVSGEKLSVLIAADFPGLPEAQRSPYL